MTQVNLTISAKTKPAMKFAVGYQLADREGLENGEDESFVDIVGDYREHIAELYFPWGDMASGRAALLSRRGYTDWTGQRRMEEELIAIKKMGVRLDLLFNANCYGGLAVSEQLENQVGSILEHFEELTGGVDIVTTTSPAIARTVKKYFPKVEVRASVNMRIGTVQGMNYVGGLFDSYYVQRDVQRDIAYVRELKAWADANGKKLCMLANSGCLRFCSGQTFHDNLVAHEKEIDETKNIANWTPHVCWHWYKDQKNWPAILQASWVRPEDLHHYEGIFEVVKLATRMHAHPRMVIGAYAERKFRGNLLDLLEPGYGPAFAPWLIDSTKMPGDWFARTSTCGARCHECAYCAKALEGAMWKGESGEEGPGV